MALNRVLVECLRRSNVDLWFGRVKAATLNDGRWVVTLHDGTQRRFDLAVFRHGPRSDLEASFPNIAASAAGPDSDVLDPARVPQWPDGYFICKNRTSNLNSRPNAYDVVELDEGFGLTSRAWSMNEHGAVVGWTQLPDSRDHAFFVWSGSGLPPD